MPRRKAPSTSKQKPATHSPWTQRAESINPQEGRKRTHLPTVKWLWRRKEDGSENTKEEHFISKKSESNRQNSMGRVQGLLFSVYLKYFVI